MKKFIGFTLMILAFVFVSCEKEINYAEEESTVVFNVDVFSNGKPLTRAIADSDVMGVVESTLPDFYYLRATNIGNNNSYTFTTQSSVTLPNGEYIIESLEKNNIGKTARWDSKKKIWNSNIGHRCDDKFTYVQTVGGVTLCNSPRITVKDTIIISKNESISLNGVFGSSAIVWDSDIVEKIQILETGNDGIFDLKCFVQSGNVCVTFHQETTPPAFDVMIYPKEGLDYEKRRLTIPSVLVSGYWYLIEPIENQHSENNFNVNIGCFQSGGEL